MKEKLKKPIIFALIRGVIYSGIFVILDYFISGSAIDLRKFLGGIIFFTGLIYIAEKIKNK